MSEQGKLIIISAPAGTGKSSVAKCMIDTGKFARAITATTREPRGQEQNGVDYFFKTKEEFEADIEANKFLEHAEVFDEYYGVPRSEVDKLLATGKHVLLVIDVQGGETIKNNFPASILIFILPPDMAELRKRLEKRGENSTQSITKRLRIASMELSYADDYDYTVVNHDLQETVQQIIDHINESN